MVNPNDALRKDLTPEEFQLFRDWIHHHSGIFLEDSKVDSLRISLVTRATRFGFNDYKDYFRVLSNDENEFKELMNLVTINETSFFRFPAQFEALRDRVIPEILDGRSIANKRFRIWSAGCSTGEEPYTISMTLRESALEALGYSMEVTGTDVSTQALDKARKGVYPDRAVNTLAVDVRQRWFETTPEGGHRPIKRVRDLTQFHFHNLIKEPYPLALMSGWDVIFCRNVTIYFRMESTRRVVNNFYEALNPGGYLFIGHSETLTSISERFEPVEINGVFLYRKPQAKRVFSFDDIVARRQQSGAARPGAFEGSRVRTREERERSVLGKSREEAKPARRPVAPRPEPAPAPSAIGSGAGVEELVATAHKRLEQARHEEALQLALDALRVEPNSLDAHVVAAFAFADLGQLDEAAAQASAALAVNPLAAPARYILGVISHQQGDISGALNEFKRTIYIDRDFVLAHFACANIHRQQGSLDDAAREYENTLRALYAKPEGSWTAFLGGFRSDLLAKTCERSLIELGKGAP